MFNDLFFYKRLLKNRLGQVRNMPLDRQDQLRIPSDPSSKYDPHTSGYSPPQEAPLGYDSPMRNLGDWYEEGEAPPKPEKVTHIKSAVKRLKNAFRFGKFFKNKSRESSKTGFDKDTDFQVTETTHKPSSLFIDSSTNIGAKKNIESKILDPKQTTHPQLMIKEDSDQDLKEAIKTRTAKEFDEAKRRVNEDLKKIFGGISIKEDDDDIVPDRRVQKEPALFEAQPFSYIPGTANLKRDLQDHDFDEARMRVSHDLRKVFEGCSVLNVDSDDMIGQPKVSQEKRKVFERFGQNYQQIVENVKLQETSPLKGRAELPKVTSRKSAVAKKGDEGDEKAEQQAEDDDPWPGHSFAVQNIIQDFHYYGRSNLGNN